jgi:hypothetical protein
MTRNTGAGLVLPVTNGGIRTDEGDAPPAAVIAADDIGEGTDITEPAVLTGMEDDAEAAAALATIAFVAASVAASAEAADAANAGPPAASTEAIRASFLRPAVQLVQRL